MAYSSAQWKHFNGLNYKMPKHGIYIKYYYLKVALEPYKRGIQEFFMAVRFWEPFLWVGSYKGNTIVVAGCSVTSETRVAILWGINWPSIQ